MQAPAIAAAVGELSARLNSCPPAIVMLDERHGGFHMRPMRLYAQTLAARGIEVAE